MQEKKIIAVEKPHFEMKSLLKAVHMDSEADEDDREEFCDMVEEASAISIPKALYGISKVENLTQDGAQIDGIFFDSKLVRENLKNTARIFPFAATCGMEAEQWSLQFKGDPLAEYWADAIKMQLLSIARKQLVEDVRHYFPAKDLSAMSPGSLPAWPLPQQKPLFRLMGGVTEDIGAYLTETFLIVPAKSCSGFFFSTQSHYENCQYCPMANCPGRRAPFQHEYSGT